jgi:hypothetical protein
MVHLAGRRPGRYTLHSKERAMTEKSDAIVVRAAELLSQGHH